MQQVTSMSNLSKVFAIKIAATLLFWCLPLILLPSDILEAAGFPPQPTYLFVRLLGWAYLALCVGYGFGLVAALNGQRLLGPIWVGIVSNGGASAYLLYYGLTGSWSDWNGFLQTLAWSSAVVAALIAAGLYVFGARESSAARMADRRDRPK